MAREYDDPEDKPLITKSQAEVIEPCLSESGIVF